MSNDMLSFPDGPRSQLDKTLADLVEQAQDVMATQGRLRALLRANQAVVESLDLADVLRRIVEAAVELVGAQYGALGVVSPSGGLEQFIHVGMPDGEVEAIGHLPEGHGLLGALIDDPQAIRLEHISDDARSTGFPAHHPPMESFLGVPVRIRDRVFGNLYLSNQRDGAFSPEDEQLVGYLAATAGFAIENARLYAETKRRQAWAAASAEVTAAMLSSDDTAPLGILLSRVLKLADADLVHLAVKAANGDVTVSLAQGMGAEALIGQVFSGENTVASRVFEGGQPLLVNQGAGGDDRLADGRSYGPVMGLPLVSTDAVEGVLMISRFEGSHPFETADLEMAADFAGQGSVALELIKARAAQQRMVLLEDRGRIARDLHDHVIQQLFGTGLELQSVASTVTDASVSARLIQSVGNLDQAISQIRTAIFALSSPTAANRDTIRHRLIDLANELTIGLGKPPSVTFAGPVDLVIVDSLAEDVFAVVRESATNVIKHAHASSCTIRLETTADEVVLTVNDDGRGMSEPARRSGIANLEARALGRGGTCSIDSGPSGTTVTWTVPIPEEIGDASA
jgi:signal transduction histidine kinase